MTTGGTVRDMRTLPADKLAEMTADVREVTAAYRTTESRHARERRNETIYKWRKALGEGSLSAIARAAEISRIQAGRIAAAYAEAEATGQPVKPTRRYYQSRSTQHPAAPIE